MIDYLPLRFKFVGVDDSVMQTTSTWPFERRRRRRVRVNTLQLYIHGVNKRAPYREKSMKRKSIKEKVVGINELLRLEAFPCRQKEERIQESDPDWEDEILHLDCVCNKGNDVTSSRIDSK